MEEARLFVGTCGYFYEEWRDVFYPKDLPKDGFLKFYSLIFPFVELDFSWYKMPNPKALEMLANQTTPGFLFSIKAHRSLTHEPSDQWQRDAETFLEAVYPLHSRGKLAGVLIQLPYHFFYTAENRKYLAELCQILESVPLIVEFRNAQWYLPRVYEELSSRSITLAMIDRPDLEGLPPETSIMTTRTVYYRLHGKNSQQWWSGDVTSRYDYEYSEKELKEKARTVHSLKAKADKIFVAFNNHARGNAPNNAKLLMNLLKKLEI